MKIAYIDGISHQKTKSTFFLRELLKQQGCEIVNFWDINKPNAKLINPGAFDAIIFFQDILPIFKLRKFKCKNLIWVPMYDGMQKMKLLDWIGYLAYNVKIISFSKSLAYLFEKNGFNVLNVQYYFKPKFNKLKCNINQIKIFFWYRTNTINWELVKTLICKIKIDKIIVKNSPDLDQTKIIIPENEYKNNNVQIIDRWLKHEEYLKLLTDSNLFIAPREFEGIGMSFLEAISFGIPVIAPNNPTMNEYITNNINGFLYDINKPQPIFFSDLSQIRDNLQRGSKEGYTNWLKQQKLILPFINKPTIKIKTIKKFKILILSYPYTLIKAIKSKIIRYIDNELAR